MHLLQLCPRVPFPLHDGGAIAMYEVARGLSEAGHRVTVLAANTPKHYQPADVLAHLGPNVRLVTVDVNTTAAPLPALRNLLTSQLPYIVERFVSPALAAKLRELLRAEQFDVVQLEGTLVAWYAGLLTSEENSGENEGGEKALAGGPLSQGLLAGEEDSATPRRWPPLVLRAHNVEYTIWQMLAGRTRNPLRNWYLAHLARRMKLFEQEMLQQVDAVAAITPEDAGRLQTMFARGQPTPAKGAAVPTPARRRVSTIAFVPAGVDLRRFQPEPAVAPTPRTLFMLGSLNWLPNQEGLAWLLREVWPVVHAEMPDLTLHVAGYGAPADLLAAPPPGVVMHGFVESAPDFMRRHALMLVPLLSGGGMRVKIIEGLALGKVILSTSLGAEGIAVQDGRDILLRDTAAAWVAAIRAWHRAELPTAALGEAAARTAAELYDTRRVTARFVALYEQLRRPVSA